MGVARSFTTAYEAWTNGVCERSHAPVNAMLAKCVADNQRDRADHVAQVDFRYNASQHESTQHTPFFLLFGMESRWDMDLQLGAEVRRCTLSTSTPMSSSLEGGGGKVVVLEISYNLVLI